MGTWTTNLLACDRRGGDGWLSVKVQNDQKRFVDIPRIARYLMQTLPLGHGQIRFVDRPQLFNANEVERLVELLRDEERHGLVLVAGTGDGGVPFDSFVNRMGVWTKEVYGLAQVIVLDPHATEAFNAAVGPRYQAAQWGIRTFFPDVDLTSQLDWRRHRILGPVRLGAMDDIRINRMFGSMARAHAASRQTPAILTRAIRTFVRLANSELLKAIDPEPEQLLAPRASVHRVERGERVDDQHVVVRAGRDEDLVARADTGAVSHRRWQDDVGLAPHGERAGRVAVHHDRGGDHRGVQPVPADPAQRGDGGPVRYPAFGVDLGHAVPERPVAGECQQLDQRQPAAGGAGPATDQRRRQTGRDERGDRAITHDRHPRETAA